MVNPIGYKATTASQPQSGTEATIAAVVEHAHGTIASRYIHSIDTNLVSAADTKAALFKVCSTGKSTNELSILWTALHEKGPSPDFLTTRKVRDRKGQAAMRGQTQGRFPCKVAALSQHAPRRAAPQSQNDADRELLRRLDDASIDRALRQNGRQLWTATTQSLAGLEAPSLKQTAVIGPEDGSQRPSGPNRHHTLRLKNGDICPYQCLPLQNKPIVRHVPLEDM